MAKPDDPPAAVSTFSDHEVITPPNKLKKAVAPKRASAADYDPVARAERALKELSIEFAGWMRAECDRLDAARHRVAAQGFIDEAHDELFRVAHDIKGQAATFGYPLAATVAESLCRVLEHTPERRIPLALVDQHVDAVRAIIRESAAAGSDKTAIALATRLRQVSDQFLHDANRDRPEYLDGILAPPLAP